MRKLSAPAVGLPALIDAGPGQRRDCGFGRFPQLGTPLGPERVAQMLDHCPRRAEAVAVDNREHAPGNRDQVAIGKAGAETPEVFHRLPEHIIDPTAAIVGARQDIVRNPQKLPHQIGGRPPLP